MMLTNRIAPALLVNLAAMLCLLAPSAVAQEQNESRSIVQIRQDAESGDSKAMVHLGEHYRDAPDPDFKRALSWFRRAANQGVSKAMDRLGGMYRDGYGVERDYGIAMDWYKKAVDAGDVTAMASIGWMYYHGLGVQKDVQQALKWYRAAAEKGGHEGMNNLGHLYLHGAGVNRDVQEAIRWFRKSSEAGNPYGYDNLGVLYLEGNGLPRDLDAAKRMFRSAARLGLTDSMIRMGRLERALDSAESRKSAFGWFSRAQGSMEGMREIGECYFDGIGVEPDPEEGLRWYQLAIDAGHPFAPADLADRLLSGRGVTVDHAKAIAILETAASNGNAGAATKLGHIASESKDYVKALEHYRVAARRGESTAMLCIAIQYQNGWGVPIDNEQAWDWLQKAADHGNDMARQILAKRGN